MLFFLEGNQEFAEALALNLLRAEKATDPADHGDGVMIAFQLEPDALPKLEVVWPKESSILPPVEHHVTLCFLGSASALEKSGLSRGSPPDQPAGVCGKPPAGQWVRQRLGPVQRGRR